VAVMALHIGGMNLQSRFEKRDVNRSKVTVSDYVGIKVSNTWEEDGQAVEGARVDRGFPFERRLPPPEAAARAILRLFFGLTLHASQNHTPSGATSSPIHPKWNWSYISQ
jgi:hypothetical protein